MEHFWNFFYLFIGAIIATGAKIIEDRLKNQGNVVFDVYGMVRTNKRTEVIGDTKFKFRDVYFNIDIINTSNEFKTCRQIYIYSKKGTIKLANRIPLFEISGKEELKRFSILHLKPNTIERFSLRYTIIDDKKIHPIYIIYKTKNGKQKKQLIDRLHLNV